MKIKQMVNSNTDLFCWVGKGLDQVQIFHPFQAPKLESNPSINVYLIGVFYISNLTHLSNMGQISVCVLDLFLLHIQPDPFSACTYPSWSIYTRLDSGLCYREGFLVTIFNSRLIRYMNMQVSLFLKLLVGTQMIIKNNKFLLLHSCII